MGLGWWGRRWSSRCRGPVTDLRFVAGAARTHTDELTAFAQAQGFTLAAPTSRRWRIRRCRRWCWRRRIRCTAPAGHRGGQGRQACLLREAVRADESRRGRGRAPPTQAAKVTLGLGYNRRFHPEMTKLRQQIRSGELGHDPARRSDDDVSQRAVPEAGRVARRTSTRRRAAR